MTERWTDETLDRFAAIVATAIQANNEAIAASNERMTRFEDNLLRLEQVVVSNNRFLESFSQDVKQLTENTNQVVQQMAATISVSNQDRMDVTTRLSAINRKVDAIAYHLGVNP